MNTNPSELKAEVGTEFAHMQRVVEELEALRRDVGSAEPTLREKTAAGTFLGQFYMGVENVLKRISKYHGVGLPEGDKWHVELLRRFCEPPHPPLPLLFDESLAAELGMFRGFRHVVRVSYGFDLNWRRLAEGIDRVRPTFVRFRAAVTEYLDRLEE